MSHASIIAFGLGTTLACSTLACTQPQENTAATQEAQASAAPVARAFTRAGAAATTLTVPIAQYAAAAPKQMGDLKPSDKEVQTGVEGAWSDDGFLSSPSCVSYAWQNLTVTIDFDACVLPTTGETLDGAIDLGVSVTPLGVSVGFDDLVLGDSSYDGHLSLGLGEKPASLALGANMSFVLDGGATDIQLEQVLVEGDPSGVTASGGFSMTAPTTADVDFAAVHWATGQCLPSSGSLSYDMQGVPVLVTFLPETPQTGVVSVQVGSLPSKNEAILPPCSNSEPL